ncbi:MAG: IPT/TIG domain-containing protein, partial [Clostridia bacterium]
MKKARAAVLFFLLIIMAVVFTGCVARLGRAVPSSGSVGSTITLKGSRFGDSTGEARVMFGDAEGRVVFWSNREIKVKVPEGADSGDISIVRDDETTKTVKFRLLEEEYDVLVEKDLIPMESVQEIEAEGLAVTLPPGIIGSNTKLVISKVSNAPGFQDDMYAETDVYSIEIGNTETFNDFLVLEFDIDKKIGDSQYIRAAYWNEDMQEWTEAPTHVDMENGVARVYTSHLTNWRLLALKQIYSVHETGRFIIAYNKKDNA